MTQTGTVLWIMPVSPGDSIQKTYEIIAFCAVTDAV